MDRIPEIIEELKLTDKGTAWSGKAEEPGERIRHLPDGYTVISDKTREGTRTIVLQEIDKSERMMKVREIVDGIATALKEGRSKAFKAVLEDVLEDSFDEEIDDLYHRIVEKKEAIVAEPGCFKLVIGMGSRQKEMMIRE